MYIVQCITKDKDDILKELCKKKRSIMNENINLPDVLLNGIYIAEIWSYQQAVLSRFSVIYENATGN
jgi:hypothetical protein